MDSIKTGQLIHKLRTEKNLTQKTLSNMLNLSDRTISKWERGLGCPDISLLNRLSEILGINVEQLLSGDINSNDYNGGNMKKIKFYFCETCGNVMFALGEASISCCGRRLDALVPNTASDEHLISSEIIEDENFITTSHPMDKDHYITFVACVSCDRVMMLKQYPEQNMQTRLPRMPRSKLYFFCTKHGLFEQRIE